MRIHIGGPGSTELICSKCGAKRFYSFARIRQYSIGHDGPRSVRAPSAAGSSANVETILARMARLTYLYKYVTSERIDILRNGFIRFTPAVDSNDLTDMLPRLSDVNELGERLARSYCLRLMKEESQLAGFCLSQKINDLILDSLVQGLRSKHGNMQDFFSSYVRRMRSQLGVLSLTEDPLNPAMWAYYANNLTGFVISFCPVHEFFFPEDGSFWNDILSPVIYSRRRRYGSLDMAPYALMFEKDRKWAHEREWRLVRMVKRYDRIENGSCHLFRLPPDVIGGVILGARMAQADRNELLALIETDERYAHVGVREVALDSGRLTLNMTRRPAIKGNSLDG